MCSKTTDLNSSQLSAIENWTKMHVLLPSNRSKSCRSSGNRDKTSKSSWFSSRSWGMSLMSLVMSSGSSSALRSGVKGLLSIFKKLGNEVHTKHTSTDTQAYSEYYLIPVGCVGRHRTEGIPRLPWGSAGGMGFWGLRTAPLLPFFFCFLLSAGSLAFFSRRRCCSCWWWYVLRLTSPRRKLSCAVCQTVHVTHKYLEY